jgi:hypothetical protein
LADGRESYSVIGSTPSHEANILGNTPEEMHSNKLDEDYQSF